MIPFAFDQDSEVVRIRGNEQAMEYFVLVAVHQLHVVANEIVIVEWIVNETFEEELVDDDRLFDDELVGWNQFTCGCFADEVGFHFVISHAV